MTQKELSYLEDAIGHEQNIIKLCQDFIKNLQDENLVTFVNEEIETHTTLKEKLLNLLEVKADE